MMKFYQLEKALNEDYISSSFFRNKNRLYYEGLIKLKEMLFMKKTAEKVININKLKGDKRKRQVGLIKEIIVESTKSVLEDKNIHGLAIGIGLQQGLKYNGNLVNGVKGALATYGAVIVANGVQNIVHNLDVIKKA